MSFFICRHDINQYLCKRFATASPDDRILFVEAIKIALNLRLFHLHPHVIHYEAVDVGCLFHHLRQWFAAAMACLAVDTDQDWGLACLTLLQTGSELERMGRNHTVVVAKAEAINSVFIRI